LRERRREQLPHETKRRGRNAEAVSRSIQGAGVVVECCGCGEVSQQPRIRVRRCREPAELVARRYGPGPAFKISQEAPEDRDVEADVPSSQPSFGGRTTAFRLGGARPDRCPRRGLSAGRRLAEVEVRGDDALALLEPCQCPKLGLQLRG
jgi:hypothetical protein